MRYVRKPSRPRSDEWWEDVPVETTRVVLADEVNTFTGLYDERGHELHRVPNPIGFRVREK